MITIKQHKSLTFEQVWNIYLDEKKLENYSPATLKGKREHMALLFQVVSPDTPINQITRHDIDRFINWKKKGVEPISINSYLRVYRAFFNWASTNGYCEKIPIRLLKVQNKIKETYTPDELDKLLKKPSMNKTTFREYRNWVIVNFLIGTGCRRTTIVNIKIEDLSLSNCTVNINTTKTNKSQMLPIPSSLKPVLLEYLGHRNGNPDDYLFCDVYGRQLNPEYLSHEIAIYNRSRGVEKTSIHAFRHTFAKIAILDCHMDVFRLQRMLGHSNIAITEQYVRMFDEELLKENDEFNPLNFVLNSRKKRSADVNFAFVSK